jgi:hypothetical protein
MTLKLFIVFIVTLSLSTLPYTYWEYLEQKFTLTGVSIRSRIRIFNSQFAKYRREVLLSFINNKIHSTINKLEKKDLKLPKYKFYTELIIKIMERGRLTGSSIKAPLKEIRSNLHRDDKFERKLNSELLSVRYQILFTILLTWLFKEVLENFSEYLIPFEIKMIMIALQVSGLIIFHYLYKFLKEYTFNDFSCVLNSLYLLRGLSDTGLPVSKVIEMGSLNDLAKIQKGDLGKVVKQLFHSVTLWSKKGTSIQRELDELINEVWFLIECAFEFFLKYVKGLKFLILVLFYLSAYFMPQFSLLSSVFD